MGKSNATCCWVRLPLEGATNVRDLGGYPTESGKMTAFHRFLRADALDELTFEDEEFLYDYGVRTVIDLRDDREVTSRPDRFIQREGVAYYHVALLGGNIADPTYISTLPGNAQIRLIYNTVVENKEKMAELLRIIIAAEPGCVLFHCSAGKDRTGVLAMVLMRIAGCDRLDCITNYSVSVHNLKRDPMFLSFFDTFSEDERSFMDSKPETLESLMDYLDETYGSIDNYLDALGLDAEEVDALKARVCC